MTNDDTKECPRCGKALEATAMCCPSCNLPIDPILRKYLKAKANRALGIAICLIGIIGFIIPLIWIHTSTRYGVSEYGDYYLIFIGLPALLIFLMVGGIIIARSNSTRRALAPVLPTSPEAAAPEQGEQTYFCPECGTAVEYGDSLCSECGRALDWSSGER